MAKILGEAGRYVKQQTGLRQQRIVMLAFAGSALTSWISGFILGSLVHKPVGWFSSVGLFLGVLGIQKWVFQRTDVLEKECRDFERGAQGEVSVGLKLKTLPDGFLVINDLATPFGNLDHVVVGPSGVFALDTKNWRGTITPDGKGELLIDGRTLDKDYV